MSVERDPIEAWREISAAAARATQASARVRPTGVRMARTKPAENGRTGSRRRLRSLGAVGALAVAVVAGAIVLRGLPGPGPATSQSSANGPVVDTVEDARFRLTLTTPRGVFGTDEAIEAVAKLTYLGPLPNETIFHAMSPVAFMIEEVGGSGRTMGGAMEQPCLHTALSRDVSLALPFAKAGVPTSDPLSGFNQAWYEDPVLRLPAGRWRIVAGLDAYIGECGGEAHSLTATNVIDVTEAPASTPSPSPAIADPTALAGDGAIANSVAQEYESARADSTSRLDVAWQLVAPWSREIIGGGTYADAEQRFNRAVGSQFVLKTPTRDGKLFDMTMLEDRGAAVRASGDESRAFTVVVDYPDAPVGVARTRVLVLAPLKDGTWRVWLDAAPGTYGAADYSEGCALYGFSERRCQAIVDQAQAGLGIPGGAISRIELRADAGCSEDPRRLGVCKRTQAFIAGVWFLLNDGTNVRRDVYCGVGSPGLICSESPGLSASGLSDSGYWDVPCTGEAPASCATPVPLPSAATASGRALRIDAMDVMVGPVGHREVEIGSAVLPDGVLTEATFLITDETQEGFLIGSGVVRMELQSTIPGRPPFNNGYERGRFDGPEEVRVLVVFDVDEARPGATFQIRDLVVR
jgi:hypothetical protein